MLAGIDKLFASEEDDKQIRCVDSKSPEVFAFDCGQLPFERMGDAHFELLLADLYTARAENGKEDWFEKACRLNDGADQGRDVILIQDSEPVGVIQCKRYNGIVSLNMIVEEICKFFLYAVIKPHIAPPPGNEFRYHLAVSDRAQGKLFEFMQGKGRQRFEDLRALFEEKALAARKASATLRKHSKLKDLTTTQLCDVIWERIDDIHTDILKKDSLSRMLVDYPQIKSTYFRLESDTVKIVEEIKQALNLPGNILSQEDEKLVSAIRTEYIDRELSNAKRFNLGLIQGDDILPFLRGMLNPQMSTLYSNFGSRPVIMAAGAKATESSHWSEINQLVKNYPYPLVFIVGCGEVTGSTLHTWMKSDEMFWIDPAWEPAPAREYRAGWCWVSDPNSDSYECYVIVENVTGDPKYDNANLSLRLAFRDVILWPTLGNDFTNPISNSKSQLRRLMASQAEDKANRPNLIIASQEIESSVQMMHSVSDYYAQRSKSAVAVVVANSGRLHECKVGIYSATGIFPAMDTEQHTRATPPGFNPPSKVMRRSSRGALMLTVDWSGELFLEVVKGQRIVEGVVKDELPPEALEFNELFGRYPPIDGYLDSVQKELDLLNALIQDSTLIGCSDFTYQTKYGVKQEEPFSIDDMHASGEYVMKAVQALSFVKSHQYADWVLEPQIKGHIQFNDAEHGKFNVMAWANHNYHVRQMEGDLFQWARRDTAHPELVVFAHCKGYVKDKKPSHARNDYTSTPSVRGAITEAQEPRNVYIFNLGEIESLYDDDQAQSVESFMEEILDRRRQLDAE
ncbi:ABC-three component system protein [Vibrio cincinnatiensis]